MTTVPTIARSYFPKADSGVRVNTSTLSNTAPRERLVDENYQEPLTYQEMMKAIGVSQSTVSRLIGELIPGGMEAYKQRFVNDDVIRGFRKHLSEGGSPVEGIYEEEFGDRVFGEDGKEGLFDEESEE